MDSNILKAVTSHPHQRTKFNNAFFKMNNQNFMNNIPEIDPTKDLNNLEYIKSLERKFEPRKPRNIVDAYSRIQVAVSVRTTVANSDLQDLIELCILSPTAFDLSMLLYKFRGSQFRCVDIVNQKWQRKNEGGEWVDDSDCLMYIRGFIMSDLGSHFQSRLDALNRLIQNTYISGDLMKPLQLKKQNLEYILLRLPTIVMKNAIIKEASELFFYSEILTP